MEALLKIFGKHIWLKINSLAFGQKELADRADINTSYIGQIERGLREPFLKILPKVTRTFNLSLLIPNSLTDEVVRLLRLLPEWGPDGQRSILRILREMKGLKRSKRDIYG